MIRDFKSLLCFEDTWIVDVKESNETEVLAILEVVRIFSQSIQGMLIVESDSSNAMSCISCLVLWYPDTCTCLLYLC